VRRIAGSTKAQWGKHQARHYTEQLRDQIKSLREFPNRFPEVEEHPGLHQMRCDQHLIFYRVSDDEIEIVQILRVARDIDNRLE